MYNNTGYKILLALSIICIIGTFATNIQQYAQFSKVKEYIEKENDKKERYEDLELLYEVGMIDSKPELLPGTKYNTYIDTPYNCLNIPVSIIFWTLAFCSLVTTVLSFTLDLRCTKAEKTKLSIFTCIALLSSLIGVIYWALNFHY